MNKRRFYEVMRQVKYWIKVADKKTNETNIYKFDSDVERFAWMQSPDRPIEILRTWES